jgi:hypothetical protein
LEHNPEKSITEFVGQTARVHRVVFSKQRLEPAAAFVTGVGEQPFQLEIRTEIGVEEHLLSALERVNVPGS